MDHEEEMSPQQQLFLGVAFNNPEMVREGLVAGADPEAALENGHTLVTEAILGGMGAPEALRLLIEHGVDLGRADANGVTPWMACLSREGDRVVAEEMAEIRQMLEAAGASKEGQVHEHLTTAAAEGDLETVRRLIEEEGVPANAGPYDPVGAAAGCNQPDVARYLLTNGWSPNRVEGEMSPLMRVASKGNFEMVRLLVEHGADVNHHFPEDPEWTAAMFAHNEGHDEIAEWLAARQKAEAPVTVPEAAREGGPLEKFAELYRLGVNGVNFDLDTDAVVRRLIHWDERYGIHVLEPGHDRVTVQFERLPDDLDSFAAEIADFCPDIIHQGFGAMDEMIEGYEESGKPLPDDIRQLVEGLDYEAEDFGVRVLARWLKQHQAVELWWD